MVIRKQRVGREAGEAGVPASFKGFSIDLTLFTDPHPLKA